MNLETILQHYGYLALFIGTLVEGETVLILAGYFAHRGYLDYSLVCLVAFFGGFLGDQIYFYLGRHKGKSILAKRPRWQAKTEKVRYYLDKYQTWLLVGFRFFYGTRTMVPFALGMSNVKTIRFLIYNVISGMIWAVAVATGGYFFGRAMEYIIGNVQRYEEYIWGGILLIGITIWLVRYIKRR